MILCRMKFSTYSKPSEVMAIAVRTSPHSTRQEQALDSFCKTYGSCHYSIPTLHINKISQFLAKHNIKTIHIPIFKKTFISLRLIKDNHGLKTSGIYCHPCECGKVYVGQTARTIEIRYQEHVRHLCHGQTEKSAVAEHLLNTGDDIQFDKTHRLNRMSTYMDRIVKESI